MSIEFGELLIESLGGGTGSPAQTCDFCGRLNYAGNAQPGHDYPQEEVDDYNRKAEKDPAGYHLHFDCDTIVSRRILGRDIVLGCPCKAEDKIASAIWDDRNDIQEFYKRVAAELRVVAAEVKEVEE